MPAPAAPTTGHTFEMVSHEDPALAPEAFDAYDRPPVLTSRPADCDPVAWAHYCETGRPPDGTPDSPWRRYLDSGDRSALPTAGALHVYVCRAISAAEREWATLQAGAAGGDTTVLHAAIVAVSLVSVTGAIEVSTADIERDRTRAGFIRYVAWTSRLWHDPDVFPQLVLHSLAGQITQRSMLPEVAATFRAAGRAV